MNGWIHNGASAILIQESNPLILNFFFILKGIKRFFIMPNQIYDDKVRYFRKTLQDGKIGCGRDSLLCINTLYISILDWIKLMIVHNLTLSCYGPLNHQENCFRPSWDVDWIFAFHLLFLSFLFFIEVHMLRSFMIARRQFLTLVYNCNKSILVPVIRFNTLGNIRSGWASLQCIILFYFIFFVLKVSYIIIWLVVAAATAISFVVDVFRQHFPI